VTRSGFASPRAARYYDTQLWLERPALRAALELAAPGPEDRVLDLATGTGALLRLLARRPDRPRSVLGVDASQAMLDRVPAFMPGWSLVRADARRLPIPDADFDVVACAFLVHLLDEDDRAEVLAEIARVLAPGGRVALVTLLSPRGAVGRSLLAPAQGALCQCLGRASGWCALNPIQELADSGLTVLRGRMITRGYASLCLLAERA
jgi:ubiquinone/menaquinone biosynthesis C-methylase UbiE